MSKDLEAPLKQLVDDGQITPIIDRSHPQTGVPEALRYLERGHARGKIVITVHDRAVTRPRPSP